MTKHTWPEPYAYRSNEGDAVGCTSCHSEAPLKPFRGEFPDGPPKLLCEVCSTTEIGRVTATALHSGHDVQLYRCIAQAANVVLEKTGAFNDAPRRMVEPD